MSWEGYGQALCGNGHLYTLGQYDYELVDCPLFGCQAKQAWIHWVDETNGCYCPEEGDKLGGGKCPAHPIKLEILEPAQVDECVTCKHRKLIKHERYKIP